jgi:hypothetical protein
MRAQLNDSPTLVNLSKMYHMQSSASKGVAQREQLLVVVCVDAKVGVVVVCDDGAFATISEQSSICQPVDNTVLVQNYPFPLLPL